MKALRPYQNEGIEFLKRRKRVILADEPGLGKTVQALVALHDMGAIDILVVCPKVAAGVWEDEANKWVNRPVRHYHGTKRNPAVLDHGIVTTNYSLLKEALRGRHYDAIIWDEPHRQLRNRKSATRFKMAQMYASASYMFFLTGTPISKSAGDLWPMLYLIDRKKFRGYWPFVQRWADVWQDNYGWHVEGVINEDLLRQTLTPYMLSRKKADVLPDLPPKTRQFIPLDMYPKQARVYAELVKDWALETESGNVLLVPSKMALLLRLRQLLVYPPLLGIDAASAAMDAIFETIEAEDLWHTAIYTPFTEVFEPLSDTLVGRGYHVYTVFGKMKEGEIRNNVHDFEHDDKKAALIVSLGSATSFTAVSTARPFFLGYDWEPDIIEQAEDRHHRLGQHDPVFPTFFIHKNTVDQHLTEILEGKTTIQRLILNPDPQLLLTPAWGTHILGA